MALVSRGGQNPSMPLTDTQKQRMKSDQRTASARASSTKQDGAKGTARTRGRSRPHSQQPQRPQQEQQMQTPPPPLPTSQQPQSHRRQRSTTPNANGVMVNGRFCSATTSRWAQPCHQWTNTGQCSRGLGCTWRHEGFPTHDGQGNIVDRCTLCGALRHKWADCIAPGGGKDPQKNKVAEAYSERN